MTKKLTIEQLLGKTFDKYCFEPTAQDRWDFVFHMTDWKSDLEALHRLYNDPRVFSPKQAHDAVFGFLAHATWHLNAAYRLLMGTRRLIPSEWAKPHHQKGLGRKVWE